MKTSACSRLLIGQRTLEVGDKVSAWVSVDCSCKFNRFGAVEPRNQKETKNSDQRLVETWETIKMSGTVAVDVFFYIYKYFRTLKLTIGSIKLE